MTRRRYATARSTLNDFGHLAARLAAILSLALVAGACGDDPAEPDPGR